MPRIPFDGFIGPTYTGDSPKLDAEQLFCAYPEVSDGQSDAKSRLSHHGTPGTKVYCTVPKPIIYAMAANNYGGPVQNYWVKYILAGDVGAMPHVYQIYDAFGMTPVIQDLGQLQAVAGQGSNFPLYYDFICGQSIMVIGWNLNQQALPYGWTIADTRNYAVQAITDANFLSPSSGCYLDGYAICTQAGSNSIFSSNYQDFNTWNSGSGPQTAQISDEPDALIAVKQDHRQVWIFGAQRTQVWYDAGNVPFPFARIDGAVMECGCAAAKTIAQISSSLMWLGSDPRGSAICYQNRGYSAMRVSTHAIEQTWAGYSVISDAVAYSMQWKGHFWYVISFPTADATWVYDATTEMWFQWGTWDAVNGVYHAALGRYHIFDPGANRHLVAGGDQTGNVYLLDSHTYTDNGGPIRRLRRSPHVTDMNEVSFYRRFELDMQVGAKELLLDSNGNPRAPQVMLRWSNDGGYTWSNEMQLPAGQIGEYMTRVYANRLGRARDRVFEISMTDPVPVVWIQAWLEVDKGAN